MVEPVSNSQSFSHFVSSVQKNVQELDRTQLAVVTAVAAGAITLGIVLCCGKKSKPRAVELVQCPPTPQKSAEDVPSAPQSPSGSIPPPPAPPMAPPVPALRKSGAPSTGAESATPSSSPVKSSAKSSPSKTDGGMLDNPIFQERLRKQQEKEKEAEAAKAAAQLSPSPVASPVASPAAKPPQSPAARPSSSPAARPAQSPIAIKPVVDDSKDLEEPRTFATAAEYNSRLQNILEAVESDTNRGSDSASQRFKDYTELQGELQRACQNRVLQIAKSGEAAARKKPNLQYFLNQCIPTQTGTKVDLSDPVFKQMSVKEFALAVQAAIDRSWKHNYGGGIGKTLYKAITSLSA